MKCTTSFFIFFLTVSTLLGQKNPKIVPQQLSQARKAWSESPIRIAHEVPFLETESDTPLGATHSDAVTSIKIGESSGILSTLRGEANPISVEAEVGQNGGSLGFMYRHSTASCGGSWNERNLLRYSFSTDGGQSWEVGTGTNTGGSNPIDSCYGLGPVNPYCLSGTRYPNMELFLPPDSAVSLDNLGLVSTIGILGPADGIAVGVGYTDSMVFNPPAIRQERYYTDPNPNMDTYLAYSLVERVPGEFFYLSMNANGMIRVHGDVLVHRGVWNPMNQEVDWAIIDTISPDHYLGYNGYHAWGRPSIAFSPDGSVGYVAGIADMIGGVDTARTVWLSKSINGGLNWGTPEQFDLRSNGELMDSMHVYQEVYPIINPITGDTTGMDTAFAGGNHPTIAATLDLVVDKKGIPHAIAVVGHGRIHNGDGTYSDPTYQTWSGPFLESHVIDLTIDSCGDLNILHLDRQNFIYGTAGVDSLAPNGLFTITPFVQASRSDDGELVFFSWTDSDASADTANDHPNLLTRAYDVENFAITPVRDHTSDDSVWNGNVLTPHAATQMLHDGANTYTLPLVAMSLNEADPFQPKSFWYFSDIHFDRANDFTEIPHYFYNCKTNPFSNSTILFAPDCGMANGKIIVDARGGVGPYSFQWSINALGAEGDTAAQLPAGLYEVVVTDSKACKDTIQIALNNVNAPEGLVDSVEHILCFGSTNGQASVVITNPTGTETFSWSNGEQNPTAVNLEAGSHVCIVTDTTSGCSAFFPIEIAGPAFPIQAQITTTDVLCFGEETGQLSLIATGGTGMLQYMWDTGNSSHLLVDLPAGNYSVVISDENGCSETITATIEESP